MKVTAFIAGLCMSVTPAASTLAFAQATTETKYVTVNGDVIRYEAGNVIVVRGADNKEIVYTLAPGIPVPADVKVGQRVTLYTEPSPDGGTQVVKRVVTTSVTPEGNIKRTTEDTRTLPSGVTTRTTTTRISGTVEAYEPGKTVTVTQADGTRTTYVISKTSTVPRDLVIGKTVSIVPVVTSGPGEPVVQTITYVTKTETVPQP